MRAHREDVSRVSGNIIRPSNFSYARRYHRNGDGGTFSPYDAKVNGDFTGLTPPFGRDFD